MLCCAVVCYAVLCCAVLSCAVLCLPGLGCAVLSLAGLPASSGCREIFVSFGGLLMRLAGDGAHLKEFKQDQRLYILIKKL